MKPGRDAAQRQIATELTALAEPLSGRCREVTSCIYRFDQGKPLEAQGSCVLLELGEGRFLISAAHVLDDRRQHRLVIPTGTKLAGLQGQEVVRVFATAARTDAEDYVDVGVVRLGPDLQAAIPGASFLRWAELDHAPRVPTGDAFCLVGYPLTKQRRALRGTELTAYAYQMAARECPAAVYASTGRNPDHSLMLGFDKRRMWGPEGVREMPDLTGASGCGVWRFGPSLRTATAPPRLAGIAVEWYPKVRKPYILATRISIVIAALVEHYPDVERVVRSLAR